MHLLIVEDEELKTAAYLQKGFRENGFVADLAESGEGGIVSCYNWQL